jgi:uncharacterized integral membrane protein
VSKINNLLSSFILASWIGLVATFSIQNITQVSVKFTIFESIRLPVGVLLSLSAGGGMVLGGILPLFIANSDNS